jgi:hypothetical protein
MKTIVMLSVLLAMALCLCSAMREVMNLSQENKYLEFRLDSIVKDLGCDEL